MFSGLTDKYEMLWKAMIRPPRAQYKLQHLGPKISRRYGLKIQRTDVTLTNKRGLKIECSHYQPYIRPCPNLPCIIYLHGNSSCRVQALGLLQYLLCYDITVMSFDFAGCGLSEGEYISLGYYERDDVQCVFEYLRSLGTVSSIGIWGRSMGAVTALMYADQNPQIGCLVLDSPFSNLQKLCKELADKYAGNLSMFSGLALSFVKKTIKQKNNFNVQDIDPLGKHVKHAYIPAFFIHGLQDDFIIPKHSQDLYEAYSGEKRIQKVIGDHNDQRGEEVNQMISKFIYNALYVGELVKPDKQYMDKQKKEKEEHNSKQIKEPTAKINKVIFEKVQLHQKQPQIDEYNEVDFEQEMRIALALSQQEHQEGKKKQQGQDKKKDNNQAKKEKGQDKSKGQHKNDPK